MFTLCVSPHLDQRKGGYPIPGLDGGGGGRGGISGLDRGVPHLRSAWGVPHLRSGWGGYPISGLDGGYPMPGLDGGGVPSLSARIGWGTPPH